MEQGQVSASAQPYWHLYCLLGGRCAVLQLYPKRLYRECPVLEFGTATTRVAQGMLEFVMH